VYSSVLACSFTLTNPLQQAANLDATARKIIQLLTKGELKDWINAHGLEVDGAKLRTKEGPYLFH
jgi:hypothetical protein